MCSVEPHDGRGAGVLEKLDTFRYESRFTTWAYRVAINLAAGELRRKRWTDISLDTMGPDDTPDFSPREDTSRPSPEREAERRAAAIAARTRVFFMAVVPLGMGGSSGTSAVPVRGAA